MKIVQSVMNLIQRSQTYLARQSVQIASESKLIRQEIARQGGLVKSEKKAAACRENGKKGGRPRKHEHTIRKTSASSVAQSNRDELQANQRGDGLHPGSSTAVSVSGSKEGYPDRIKDGRGCAPRTSHKSGKRDDAAQADGSRSRSAEGVVSAEVVLLACEAELDSRKRRIIELTEIATDLLDRLVRYEISDYTRAMERKLNG